MQATAGDRLVVHGHQVGDSDRRGEILQVHGEDGAPPYLVRWSDGRQSVFFPSSDTTVEHLPAHTVAGRWADGSR
jgi:Domain of unknown function (DUF1918)